MEEKDTSLGISFSSDKIRFTELTAEGDRIKLEHLEAVAVDFNFDEELHRFKSNQKILSNLSNEILQYLSRREPAFNSVSLAISSSQAFMVTVPVDFSEGKQSFNSKIYWELSNFFPDNYSDFVLNTYKLNSLMPSLSTDEFLIIAVQKNTIEFINRVFKMCSLNLKVIDIDHFAAEHCFRMNYPEVLDNKTILLLGLNKSRMDYGLIRNRKYSSYTSSRFFSPAEYNLSLVKKLNSIFLEKPKSSGPDAFYIYGDEVKGDTMDVLGKLLSEFNGRTRVKAINPFENISASDIFLKNEELRKISYQYAPSCGAALRGLNKN